jgi:hypothetical protein
MLALYRYGLDKFFKIHGMRAQVKFLEFLVNMCEPNKQVFKVGVHDLSLDIEEIYFLTRISRHGERISLSGIKGGDDKTENYIAQHCIVGTRKSSGKILIKNVRDLSLRTILFTITRVSISESPHLATNSYAICGRFHGSNNDQLV